ncbi:MAG: DoxX family protein [Beijerinckiaceae bacterium]|nr:DoxX family protein [Beijerinckiaceae bacterium]MCI0734670.1 DoxX family protein [Beijerinckiaceae bacterium]
MPPGNQPALGSKAMRYAGWIMRGLVVAFLVFDSVIKLLKIDPVIESFAQLGYPISLAQGIGFIELTIAVLYAVPRTSVLGAILLTGLLGGAVASHLRLGSPIFTHVLFGTYAGLLAWGGLFFNDARLRALIPLRRQLSTSGAPQRPV